jgi:hypothetical protein
MSLNDVQSMQPVSKHAFVEGAEANIAVWRYLEVCMLKPGCYMQIMPLC